MFSPFEKLGRPTPSSQEVVNHDPGANYEPRKSCGSGKEERWEVAVVETLVAVVVVVVVGVMDEEWGKSPLAPSCPALPPN